MDDLFQVTAAVAAVVAYVFLWLWLWEKSQRKHFEVECGRVAKVCRESQDIASDAIKSINESCELAEGAQQERDAARRALTAINLIVTDSLKQPVEDDDPAPNRHD